MHQAEPVYRAFPRRDLQPWLDAQARDLAYVYLAIGQGEVLYVGKSWVLADRLRRHAAQALWWGEWDDMILVEWPKEVVEHAELHAIMDTRPLYNVVWNWGPR